ncbi:glycosyltransferase family 2 protein [Flavobacterium ajazii]|uniref:glycosyltransferase family 2 protein n=1 Tax=Flavobacterium ajazii TaxID=2692318 RepID=UPI0013D21CF3|nr:glycosyltransferase family 2 protein [Flavobacterium ajazii]
MPPKISIITINYNDIKGLEKTIKSIIHQTQNNYEFIVIDGGSTDGGKELIERYSEKIDFWVSEPDSGVYNAMNKGIKAATGDFIIFMNSGDTFYENTVLEKVNPLLVDDFDIYYGDNYKVKQNSKRKKTYPEKLSFSFFYNSCINHQSTFIRRQLFFDYFLYNEKFKIVADWEFFIYTICVENRPSKYLKMTICNYDFTGISSKKENKSIADSEKQIVFDKYFPLFTEDYKLVSTIKSKRIQQILYIKTFPTIWKLFKVIINFLALLAKK